ncbi:MAG: ATP-binding protein [Bacteroidota bacterium]
MGKVAFFEDDEFIIRLEKNTIDVIPALTKNYAIFNFQNKLYAIDRKFGLTEWDGTEFSVIPRTQELGRRKIKAIFPFGDADDPPGMLFLSKSDGLYLLQNDTLRPLPSTADPWLKTRCYSATRLPDGNLAVATYGSGLLLLDSRGQLLQRLDEAAGLPDDLVIHAWYDGRGGLWLGLNKGLARLSYPTDLEQFDARLGLEDPVVGLAHLGEELIAATSSGLFRASARPEAGYPRYFDRVAAFPYGINDLQPYRDAQGRPRLLLTDLGHLYDWDGRSAPRKLDFGDVAKKILLSTRFPGRAYVGGRNALHVVEYGSELRLRRTISLRHLTPDEIYERPDGEVWLSNDRLLRLPLGADSLPAAPMEVDSNHGWRAEMGVTGLRAWRGEMLLNSEIGLHRWEAEAGQLRPANDFPAAMQAHGVWLFEPLGPNSAFVTTGQTSGVAQWTAAEGWQWDTTALKYLPTTTIRAVEPEGHGVLWLGTDDGLFRYRRDHQKDYAAPFSVFVRAAIIGQDSLLRLDGGPVALAPAYNDIRFSFTATELERPEALRFRHRLRGYRAAWSPWSERRFAEYTNLPGGNYTFEIEARNQYDRIERIDAFAFTVGTPAYRQWWAIGLYLLGLAGGVILIVQWRLRRLLKAKERLELLVRERTSEIEAQKQQIIAEKQETEKQKERAEESERVKKRFFANMTHELRTPLTLILGPVGRLREEIAEAEAELQLVERNGRKLLRLINQLLDISKIESERMVLHPVRSDLAAFAGEVTENFRPAAREKGLLLHCEVPEAPLAVDFDPEKMEKVLFNLLANAIKLTPAGERVDLRVFAPSTADPTRVTLEVGDAGVGISPEALPHVFDRFYQSEGGRGQRGTGIGLALCRELVELHAGAITVQSEVGRGTIFRMVLPVRQTQAVDETPASQSESVDLYLADTRPHEFLPSAPSEQQLLDEKARNLVLVVEDNADVRRYIRSCIPEDFAVLEAEDGEMGLEMALRWVPDLVVTDLMMPRRDGYELTAALRQAPATSHIPVVMLTSRAEAEARLQGLATGAEAYLTKPFNPAELQVRIRKLIEMRQALRERFRGELLLQPDKVKVDSVEEVFLRKVHTVVAERYREEKFGADDMAAAVELSRVQFNRKFKALSGATPNKFLRKYRLDIARQLVEQDAASMAEIGFRVGFSSAAYFSKCFADEFGMSPSQFRRQLN